LWEIPVVLELQEGDLRTDCSGIGTPAAVNAMSPGNRVATTELK
jgi:hypothetical protein